MKQLLGSSITYRIAVGPQQGRKVFTLQTLADCRPENPLAHTVGKVAGFSLHAGVATRAHERDKWLENRILNKLEFWKNSVYFSYTPTFQEFTVS